jgi:membrane protein DedA with SNARE-associated domain
MLAYLVQTYGYAAIFLGTVIEGETLVLMGGFAAHRNYLDLGWVIVAAFAGSFLGDQVWFHVGRKYGDRVLAKRPTWRAKTAKATHFLERRPALFILGFRFLYGLRTISPIVVGITRVSSTKYAILNAIGAMLWSVCFSVLGYAFGNAVKGVLGRTERYELIAFGLLALGGGVFWLFHFLRNRQRQPLQPS